MKIKKIIKILILIIIAILLFCLIMKNFFPAEWSFITPHKQGDFVRVGNMHLKHHVGNPILLDDGNILLFGKEYMEIYDQKTRKFKLINNIFFKDSKPTNHVRLKNGKIFLTCKKQNGYNKTYIYDPNTNIFKSGPDLLEERYAHNLTLLEDGKVFISGGYIKNNSTKTEQQIFSTEYYDPSANKIKYGPIIKKNIFNYSVISYDKNSILIIGGFMVDKNNSDININQDIFLIDINRNVILKIGTLSVKRERQDIFKLSSGDILIMQGFYDSGSIANEIEIYNPKNSGSVVVSTFLDDRRIKNTAYLFYTTQPWLNTALLRDDKILFFGGKSSNVPFDWFYKEANIYDIQKNTFSVLKNKTNCIYNKTKYSSVLLRDGKLLLLNSENNDKCSEIYITN